MRTRNDAPTRRTTTSLTATLAVVGLLAAACGGSDDSSNDATPEVVVLGDESAGDGELVVVGDGSAGDGSAAVVVDDAAAVVDEDALGSDDADDADAAGSDDADDADVGDVGAAATDEEIALAFAQCMRDEGIDWPDPVTNADGSIDLLAGGGPGARAGGGAGGADEATQAAFEVCAPIIEGASFLPGGGDGFDAETQDAFLEFTECLREQGLDVDDPDFSNFQPGGGGGGGGGLFGEDFDPQDPANADAIEACQGIFAGALGR